MSFNTHRGTDKFCFKKNQFTEFNYASGPKKEEKKMKTLFLFFNPYLNGNSKEKALRSFYCTKNYMT